MDAIHAHNYGTSVDKGSRDYKTMRRSFPSLRDLPSHSSLQTEIAAISGLRPVDHQCCVNTCVKYVWNYASLDRCPRHEPQLDSNGHPRNIYSYLPIIPRLTALPLNPKRGIK